MVIGKVVKKAQREERDERRQTTDAEKGRRKKEEGALFIFSPFLKLKLTLQNPLHKSEITGLQYSKGKINRTRDNTHTWIRINRCVRKRTKER